MTYLVLGAGAIGVTILFALYCSLAFREDGERAGER